MSGFDYDALVIGSGFGGSVTALRLAEKGYRVGVVEAGRRFDDPGDPVPGHRHRSLPKTSWRTGRYLWAPALGLTGIQRIHLLRGEKGSRVLVLAGAGVGGGSLNYGNTLYRPAEPFYDDRQWRGITDWRAELAPFYDQAERMLGVEANPTVTAADLVMRKVADRMGRGGTFHPTRVGVWFGDTPGQEAPDPFFGGAGPRRATCTECGACMTGCRNGAKNMLTENYLYLAERAGAQIMPMTTATAVRPRPGGFTVEVKRTGSPRRRQRTLTAEQVVFAAGTWGTQKLLHRMKAADMLPRLSDRLGVLTRTNSEAILGAERARRKGDDYTRGVAITSSFFPDEHTHIEPVRYGRGCNEMGSLRTLLVDGGGRAPRWAKFLGRVAAHPAELAKVANLRHWSERTVIALVMQSRDNSVTVRARRGRLGWGNAIRARSRRAEPGVDPQRPPRHAHPGRGNRRDRVWHLDRPVQHPDDRAFPRRRHDRRLTRHRSDRPLPPGLRLPGAAHRRRLGHLGQPWREPGAHHHRPGRASPSHVAQPRRTRPTARPRRRLPAAAAGCATPSSRPRRRARRAAPAAAAEGLTRRRAQ